MSDVPSAPLLSRRQLLVVVVALLAVVAAVVGAAVVLPPALRAAAPERPVRAYLQAVADGDIERALELGHIAPAAGDKLLTDAAYDQASARVTAFTVLGSSTRGTRGTVQVRITQGGERYVADFDVTRASRNPLASWRLAAQRLPEITVQLAAPIRFGLTLAGVDFTASTGSVTQHVFPGSYSASSHASGKVHARDATATATFDTERGEPAVMQLELTPDGMSAATAQVQAWVDACAASDELQPAGCPFQAVPGTGTAYSNGRWTVQSEPRVSEGEWNGQLGGWPVVTSEPGYVTFTARASQAGLTGTATTGSNPFRVAGVLVPEDGGEVRFVPAASYSSSDGAGSLA